MLRDSDEWRGVQSRLVDLERRLGITDGKVDKLVDRQELQHAENKRELEENKNSIRRIGTMLVGEKGDNGLVGTVTTIKGQLELANTRIDVVGAGVDALNETFRRLPKNVLTILLIFGALITLLMFLGPSLRKAVGMNASASTYRLADKNKPLDSSIPASISINSR